MNIDDTIKTMGDLNKVLHVAFEDIMDINFQKNKRMVIVLWNGAEYFFYCKDGKWEYDGYGMDLTNSNE